MLRYYEGKFPRDLELPANLHIFVYIESSHVTALDVKFYCEIGFKHCVKGCYEESETGKVSFFSLGDS